MTILISPLVDQRVQNDVIALLHKSGAGLTRIAADQDVVAFRHFCDDGFRSSGTPILWITADIASLLGTKDQIIIRRERNSALVAISAMPAATLKSTG